MSASFLQDINEVLGPEEVRAVLLGQRGDYYDPDDPPEPQMLTWDEARPLLDYNYDDGFGGVDCHCLWVWTPTRVLFVSRYDGATRVCQAPRHPSTDIHPYFPGGG